MKKRTSMALLLFGLIFLSTLAYSLSTFQTPDHANNESTTYQESNQASVKCKNSHQQLQDDDQDAPNEVQLVNGDKYLDEDSIVSIGYDTSKLNKIVFGGGCFWCIQAMFDRLKGVKQVQSGYAGGYTENPSYYEVKAQKTGHAEVVSVQFDPTIINYETLLYIFMHVHDPTTVNRQGQDVGSQYRSIILYDQSQPEELQAIKAVLEEVKKDSNYPSAPAQIVTEIKPLTKFYPSQGYHKDYYDTNPQEQYCQAAILPKIGKLKKLFSKFVDHTKF